MNNVSLTGRLTREPELRYGGQDNSTAITRFTLAVDDGKDTDFINIRQVDILDLNIRTGAGTNYAKTGETTGKGVFTIVEVKAGQGASAGWGRLKSGAGWISLDYATRLA